MKPLRPLPRLEARRQKVALHYFKALEAWWEVSDQSREEWSRDHRLLDEGGALRPGGWLEVEDRPVLVEAFDRAHRSWFTVAQQTFETGEAYVHREPAKRFYVGNAGVLAVVAAPDEDPRLVTSFRPEPPIPGNPVGDSATRAYLGKSSRGAFRRAAVRRIVRGASR